MYWIYRTQIFFYQTQQVQAKLVAPLPRSLMQQYGKYGFRSPMQDEPYGTNLALMYEVNPDHAHPDNYFESAGFTLFSERLVELMQSFGVKCEVSPVTVVDKYGVVQPHLKYYVFHSLEGVLDAMDEQASQWMGDHDVGIPRLVLNCAQFDHRPIFKCNHLYVCLIRDDLKKELRRREMTGFTFLAPERYRSGSYGFAPGFDD